jgi:hypothetical protein
MIFSLKTGAGTGDRRIFSLKTGTGTGDRRISSLKTGTGTGDRLKRSVFFSNLEFKASQSVLTIETVASISSGVSVRTEISNTTLRPSADLSVEEIFKLASKKMFPRRQFLIENTLMTKTAVLNMFTCPSIFGVFPKEKIKFVCKVCKYTNETYFKGILQQFEHQEKHLN